MGEGIGRDEGLEGGNSYTYRMIILPGMQMSGEFNKAEVFPLLTLFAKGCSELQKRLRIGNLLMEALGIYTPYPLIT